MAPTAPDERRQELAELAGVADQLGDPTLAFWATYWGFWTDFLVGDIRRFAAGLDEADRLARALGQPFYRWMIGYVRSSLSRIVGHLAEAEAVARETLELGQAAGIPDSYHIYGSNLFFIRYDQGRLDDVLELLRRAVAREHHNPLTPVSLAVALCELDRGGEARTVFDEAATGDFGALPGNFLWLFGLSMAAEACAWLGDTDRAAILHARLAPHCGLLAKAGPAAIGAVDHYVALLATTLEFLDEAEARFAAAEAIHQRAGAPTWLARTRLEWARMLLTRRQPGDAERARELLGQALASARELGLGNVERRTVALLQ
jgi:tetratricopeptide (TPR) repeat protein